MTTFSSLFEMAFKKSFIWRSTMGMDFRAQVWKREWKTIFFLFKTGSGFRDTGGTLPPKESVVGYWWNLLILPHNLIRNHDTVELCLIRSSMSRKKLNVLTGDRIGSFLNKKIYGCFCWKGQKEIEKQVSELRVKALNKCPLS